ncbi:MAG: PaaI family thioesterase [Burkholderiaceae bacterium]
MTDAWLFPEGVQAPLLRAIGFDAVLRFDPSAGSVEVRYIARAEHTHSHGRIVQGGFVTAWLDSAMAFAARARDAQAGLASLDVNVSFLQGVGQGPVVARARVLRWGGRVAFLEAELFGATSDGKADIPRGVLARATSTAMLRRS